MAQTSGEAGGSTLQKRRKEPSSSPSGERAAARKGPRQQAAAAGGSGTSLAPRMITPEQYAALQQLQANQAASQVLGGAGNPNTGSQLSTYLNYLGVPGAAGVPAGEQVAAQQALAQRQAMQAAPPNAGDPLTALLRAAGVLVPENDSPANAGDASTAARRGAGRIYPAGASASARSVTGDDIVVTPAPPPAAQLGLGGKSAAGPKVPKPKAGAREQSGNWLTGQPMWDQIGAGAGAAFGAGEAGGGFLGKLGKAAMEVVGPDTEAWGDFFRGDATLGDAVSMALDASILVPGAGLVARTAGKAALKGMAKTAGKEGLEAAAKNAAKKSPARKDLKALAASQTRKSGKDAGQRSLASRLLFDEASLGTSSKAAKAAKAAKGAKGGAAAPTMIQSKAGQTAAKMLEKQRKFAPDNMNKHVNGLLGRNKGLHPFYSTSKLGMGTKLGVRAMTNADQLTNPFGGGKGGGKGGEKKMNRELTDVPFYVVQQPGGGYTLYGGGYGDMGGGGDTGMQISKAQAAAIAAGNYQSDGQYVNLS